MISFNITLLGIMLPQKRCVHYTSESIIQLWLSGFLCDLLIAFQRLKI